MSALTAAERVRNSRWVNKLEELADQLLEHLNGAPSPLPREPVIDPSLVDQLSKFTLSQDDLEAEDYPDVRFLELGNGNQVANRRKALKAAIRLFDDVEVVDDRTVHVKGDGICHFAAYTHLKGAMISSTRMSEPDFGGADWHQKERIMMFRDAGDGRCIVYICPIKPLFDLRTIGHHGVTWEDVRKVALETRVIRSVDAVAAAAE